MREMVSDQLDRGVWRLLWVPPTLPYWPLEGPFHDKAGVTKTLLFSAWNVVPDVVSAILSYEAERRMTGGRIRTYLDPARQQVPLLRLTQSATRIRSRHRLLLLLLPCLPLASITTPIRPSSTGSAACRCSKPPARAGSPVSKQPDRASPASRAAPTRYCRRLRLLAAPYM